MFEVLDGILYDHVAIYVSVPITTGPRFLEWRRGQGAKLSPTDKRYERQHELHVIRPNRERVKPIIGLIRQRLGPIVIDPTTLHHVPGWKQPDYHEFWTRVIERYVGTVVFMDGWQYSSGCTHEFIAAIRVGAKVLREDLTPLSLHEGEKLVSEAIDALSDEILPTAPLREALREIHDLAKRGDWRARSSQ